MAVAPLATEPFGPLGLIGNAPVPNIETRTEEQLFQDVITPTGLKPIQPGSVTPATADPFAEFQDAPPETFDQFQDAPDAFAEFKTADDLDVSSVDELNANRDTFDPVAYFSSNPDAASDPAKLKKLLDVYRKRREEGLTAGGVIKAAVTQTPGLVGEIAGGAKRLVERGIDILVQPTANVILGSLTGDIFDDKKRAALFDETRKVVRKGVGEVSAGSEAATVGLVDLTRTGLRKLPESKPFVGDDLPRTRVSRPELPPTKPKTDQELLRDIADDASFRQNAAEILTGQGEAAKNFGLDKETLAKEGITLDEKAIEQLSLVDPITMVATGGAFKLVGVGGKVLGTARSLEGAQKIADKLASVVKYSTGKAVQGTGKVISGTGTLLKGTGTGAATIAGISSAVSGGGIPQSLIVGGVVKAVGPAMREGGKKLAHFGRAIAGEVPVSAAAQKVLDYAVKPTVGAVSTVGRGAATGIVAGSPFAIAADTDEQAGALIGAGAALGAAGGAGVGAFRVVKNSAARRYFGENRPVLEDVPSPAYGKEPELDAKHSENIQKLSAQDASELNNFREILRPQGGEFYSLDRATWRREMERVFPDITPEQLDIYENHNAFFDEAKGPDRRVVYLNADNKGLRHDAGHIFDSILTPEKRTELRNAVKDTFGQKSIDDFKETYQQKVGNKISDAAALDEFIAEQFNALFHNVPVTELNAPKSLLNKFIDVMAEGAEVLGIDIGKGVTTPSLGAPVSVGIRKLFQNAAGEVTRRNVEGGGPAPTNVEPLPPTPPPAPPGTAPVAPPTNVVPLTPPPANVVPLAPAPPAQASRSIRVTPEQVAAFKQQASPGVRALADARARETGVEYARGEAKKAEGSTNSRIIEQISDSMESGAPVVGIEHLGITSVSTPEAPLGRGGRRPEQSAGYAALEAAQLDVRQNAPPEIVAQHSKNFVPVRWTDQGGTPTLIAMSLDKVISNVLRVAADPKAADLIPYSVENGKLTPDGWREVVADAQAYSENQANGRKGDGGRLEVPEAGLSIPAENPAYTPQPLTPERANFQNLVQGLAPPQTSRAQPGITPGNIKGQLLAEANRRAVEIPANIPTKQAGRQAFVDFPPRVVQEVNPLRNEMVRRGVRVRDLLEVTERIRAKDIVSATPKPEINYKAPVTDIIRGGFQPAPTEFRQKNLGGRTVEEFSDYILKASPDEWKAATDNMTGGLTGGAWNLGLGLKDAADVGVLKSYADKFSDSAKAAMKAGEFDSAMSQVSRGQFFREAYEAATGTGSAGAAFKRGAAGMESAKPPFPIEAVTTESTSAGGRGTTEAAKFQPGKKKQTAGEYFQSLSEPETRAEREARMEFVWVKGKKIEPAIAGDEAARESEGWISATLDPNRSIGFGYHDDFPMFLDLPEGTQKTLLNYAKQQNINLVYNGEGVFSRDKSFGPDEKAFPFLPAEQLEVGTATPEPELRIVPTPASAGGTPPIEPPTGTVIPPPIAAGRFQPAEQLQEEQTPELKVVPAVGADGTPTTEPTTVDFIPPPVAAGAFQPRTESGRKLEEKGFEVIAAGDMGSRTVTILDKDKLPIARIQSVQLSPKKAEISFVTKKAGAPAGLGEVLYREVGSRLRDDGVTSLGGHIIRPEPLVIRKKIFGGFKKLTVNDEPATYESALATAERLRYSGEGVNEVAAIEPVNEITAATRFLPEGQQDMNFIRQGDAAIKVRDIERERNRLISELKVVQDKDRDALVERLAQVSREAEGAWRDFTRSRAGFLPGKRDAQGRPLNKEGEIDYAKWQKEGLAARKKQEAAPIEAAEPTGPVTEDAGVATGWITPDKKFVPLDAAFHEQYLAENSEALNKKFGTDFSDVASTDDRLSALNAGFVRLRNQGGRLSVEVNSDKWPSLKSKVLSTLQDREGRFDSLTLSLLNSEGQQVDSTSAARLHEMTAPEKLNAIEEAVNTVRSGGPRFQPAEGGLPGIGVPTVEEAGRARAARRISTVKKNNPEAVTPQYARDESGEVIVSADGSPKPLTLDYNFIESPLAKEAAKGLKGVKREEAAAEAIGKKLVDFYREVEKNPEIKAGAKWYSTARTRLKKVFGDDSKFFAELLGATSARTPVETNYRFALDAYNQFKAGAYDKTLAKYREGKAAWESQDLGDFKGETRGQFMDFWVRKHDLGVTQSSGKKFGMNSRAVLRVLDGSWASEVQGPKTPNFAGNLTGESFRATIDVWSGRTLNRLSNEGLKTRWRILPENEVGINNSDFYLGQAAYESAAKKLGIRADALQAVLWFGEKEKWEKNGWTRGAGALKSDFNVLLSETERAPSGELRMKTPQIGLDFPAELGDLKKKR